ncbi:MAG: type I methionyl aminopeptidase [Micrococcales bacterium]
MSRQEYTLKTNDQIIRMCEAGVITASALKAIRENIKVGMTSLDIDEIAEAEIIRLGGHSNFKLVPGYSHTICVSVNDEVVHGIPSKNRVFQPGDIISIDCGAETADGWNGDSAMTIVLPGGDPKLAEVRNKLSAVTEGSLWAGIAALAKAKHLNEVGAAVQKYILSNGNYGILEDYVGHGIGRSMHEDPPVYNFAVRNSGPKVVPGLCVAIEPMVTAGSKATKVLGDGWTVSTKDGKDASHWEHSVAVHEKGIWVLTAFDGGASDLAAFDVVPVDPRNI